SLAVPDPRIAADLLLGECPAVEVHLTDGRVRGRSRHVRRRAERVRRLPDGGHLLSGGLLDGYPVVAGAARRVVEQLGDQPAAAAGVDGPAHRRTAGGSIVGVPADHGRGPLVPVVTAR